MLGLAPVSVDVEPAALATSTPVGIPSAPPARPALQVVQGVSSPDLGAATAAPATDLDTVPPRSRAASGKKGGRGIVVGVMGV
ncbi:MAG TPA: hypothetical protein VF395_09125, partial [Polyangiaceae bacterium]